MPSQAEIDLAWQEWHRDFSGSQVYFVQRGHDPDGPIKIGSSKNPRKRIQQLQTSSAEPLVLLARCDGSGALEREYHKRFSSDRLNGEWFRPSTAITQEVDRLRRSHGAVAKFNPLASGEGASHV